MRKSLVAAATGLLLLFGASAASANTVTSNFDAMTPGTVDTQQGWSATGPYDQWVGPSAVTGFGTQSLRVSSFVASGSFSDWVFSTPADPASESTNQGFTSEFSFKALGNQVNGSHLSISPDNGQGARMSYVRLEDNAAGVQVFFDDVPN